MSATSSLRETLNGGNPNEVFDAMVRMNLGDVLSYAISKMGYTETGITVTANVATLAAAPKALFQCVAVSATHAGVKKLRRGPITGPNALVPAAGECVWDGGTKVLFAAYDVVATASFVYAVAADIASATEAELVNS
jgi:hypothetical protein